MAKNVLPKHWNGSEFEELHIVTKASNVFTNDYKSVQQKIDDFTSHLADYTLQVPYAEATGTANTYSVTLNPAPTSLVAGLAIAVKIPVDSTGTSTLNVNGLGAKTIKKANGSDVTNLKAGGIYTLRYDGVNFILQGEGASGNATASDLLSGKTATTDAGEITGTMPNRGAVSHSLAINGTYTIPEGYHNGSGQVTQSIPTKGAATITPGTTNQVIAAGQYLAGNQIILGDANLVPGNIKKGVNIFGVIGTYQPVILEAGNDILVVKFSSGEITHTTYTKYKEAKILFPGTVRVSFRMSVLGSGGATSGYGRIYRNGIAIGVERVLSASSGSGQEAGFTEDVEVQENDLLQLYFKKSGPGTVRLSDFIPPEVTAKSIVCAVKTQG